MSLQPKSQLKILPLEPAGAAAILAHYNPKEVQLDDGVAWSDHPAKDGALGLEFTHKNARTMSIEVLFDGAEQQRSVRPEIDALRALLLNVSEKIKRPPMISVLWGEDADATLPRFPAVLESLSVKLQMFATDGTIVRATATLKIKEAGKLGIKKPGK